ncbi:MAG: UDP-N-acetylmuramoyl-L-alanyl-D-glutamate--2,6-diaminopimelate ligase [Acidimicrobiia bacterium]|nr:MAG: UDP-N-acetylmuramoyl-L-alanyl-D-glutamate--2,6-diaminopimelate ligase [Acidimicrobiia bacterium]
MADGTNLGRLAAACGATLIGDEKVSILDVDHDSRVVGAGSLFVAIRGGTADGHSFVPAAIAAGAAAVCVEDAGSAIGVPALVVPDTRAALGPLASLVHGDPSRRLRVVGVTGTNGKTTVTHLVGAACRSAGIPTAVMGTVGAQLGDRSLPMERTTPEASDFQRLLAEMVESGIDVAAVEVSSHGLAMGRVSGTRFAVGAFTNLSQDHLDFHGDMESYEAAKATLFELCDNAVVWIDDPAGDRIAARLSIPSIRVGTGSGVDLRVASTALGLAGSEFTLEGCGLDGRFRVALAGRFNIANAAVAAGCAAMLGVPMKQIAAGLASVPPVPGRFELVPTPLDCSVVVDYAHTPDGVAAAISSAREIVADAGRVIVVVGAGGDRDRAKRPLMGAAASQADLAVFTSDNPRSEDPEAVVAAVAGGADGPGEVVTVVDRRLAIRTALESARVGDMVLVLGKGHEQGQDFGDRVLPFDDRQVVREEAGR